MRWCFTPWRRSAKSGSAAPTRSRPVWRRSPRIGECAFLAGSECCRRRAPGALLLQHPGRMRDCFPSVAARIFTCKGELPLDAGHLTFTSLWRTAITIPLKDIEDLSVGQFQMWTTPWVMRYARIIFLSVSFRPEGQLQTVHLTPVERRPFRPAKSTIAWAGGSSACGTRPSNAPVGCRTLRTPPQCPSAPSRLGTGKRCLCYLGACSSGYRVVLPKRTGRAHLARGTVLCVLLAVVILCSASASCAPTAPCGAATSTL